MLSLDLWVCALLIWAKQTLKYSKRYARFSLRNAMTLGNMSQKLVFTA